jgi:DNA (cytosine-5)-methyltransferase 1
MDAEHALSKPQTCGHRITEGKMNELALFAGAGGGILAGKILGWRTICAVEIDPYAASVLASRQNDGCLAPFPIWNDVRTFDGRPWKGRVDIVSGGFPCQDVSSAGKGAGIDGKKSGIWSEMARIIREVRPRCVFVENSPMLTSRGLHRVLGDLAEMGFDAEWGVLGADDVGAPHIRKRIWILADASIGRRSKQIPRKMEQPGRTQAQRAGADSKQMANASGVRLAESQHKIRTGRHEPYGGREDVANAAVGGRERGRAEPEHCESGPKRPTFRRIWEAEPDVGRVANGVANRVDRLKCLGNGQVPAVAAAALALLQSRLGKETT